MEQESSRSLVNMEQHNLLCYGNIVAYNYNNKIDAALCFPPTVFLGNSTISKSNHNKGWDNLIRPLSKGWKASQNLGLKSISPALKLKDNALE